MPRDNTTRNRLRQEPVQSLSYDSLTTNMISPQQQGSQHHPSTPYYYPPISHQYSNLHYYHPHLHLPNLFIRPNYISFFPHPFHFLLSTTYGQESNFKPPVPNQRPIKLRWIPYPTQLPPGYSCLICDNPLYPNGLGTSQQVRNRAG